MIEWFSIQSTAAAIQNLLLAAHSQGLATCWIGDLNSALLAELFTIPKGYEPVAIIALGYPAAAVPGAPPGGPWRMLSAGSEPYLLLKKLAPRYPRG